MQRSSTKAKLALTLPLLCTTSTTITTTITTPTTTATTTTPTPTPTPPTYTRPAVIPTPVKPMLEKIGQYLQPQVADGPPLVGHVAVEGGVLGEQGETFDAAHDGGEYAGYLGVLVDEHQRVGHVSGGW